MNKAVFLSYLLSAEHACNWYASMCEDSNAMLEWRKLAEELARVYGEASKDGDWPA